MDSLFRSDRLYSAVCHAMLQLGHLEEWLAATAEAPEPAAVLSSLFPFQGDTLFAPPPETVWPPAASTLRTPSPVFLTKVRWRAAKFVPVPLIEALLTGTPLQADQWIADAESGCLLRRDRPQASPFRLAVRARVPVDRLTGISAEPHQAACIEFEQGAGLWAVVLFAGVEAASVWKDRVTAAFRLLCDSGFGGSRSAGWGQAGPPEIGEGTWPGILLPKLAKAKHTAEPLSSLHWLLSVYSPANSDRVEWGEGRYTLVLRGGRVQSRVGSGVEKKTVRMVAEGSVLWSADAIHGRAVDVGPDGFAHPVYRAGFALALQLPVIHVVETPEPEPAVSEMEATLAAALAAAEEERTAAQSAPAAAKTGHVTENAPEPEPTPRVDSPPTEDLAPPPVETLPVEPVHSPESEPQQDVDPVESFEPETPSVPESAPADPVEHTEPPRTSVENPQGEFNGAPAPRDSDYEI